MLARALSAAPWGIDARAIHIEVDLRLGLPQMQLVGLPDAAVRESRERVRSAVKNCGFELPPRSVIINLAPADVKKEGNHLDLAIALALLVAHGHLPEQALIGKLVCGELGLSGTSWARSRCRRNEPRPLHRSSTPLFPILPRFVGRRWPSALSRSLPQGAIIFSSCAQNRLTVKVVRNGQFVVGSEGTDA